MRRKRFTRGGPLLLAMLLGATAAAEARLLPFLPGTAIAALSGADNVVAGDLDRDGDVDFAVARSAQDEVLWLESTPSGFVQHLITSALDQPNDLATGDLDCDGDLDLVIAVRGTDEVLWRRNDAGATSWPAGGTISAAATDVLNLAVGDLTGNGTLDVVAAGSGPDEVVAWGHTSCSSAVWTTNVISSALAGARTVEVADTNSDARLDVVGIADGDTRLAVWERNPVGVGFTRVDLDTTLSGAFAVGVGDLDGDGDSDVAATSGLDDEVAWWANPGGAGAWVKATVATLPLAQSLQLADVDGDGDLDVVATSSVGGPLSWFDNAAGDGSAWSEQELEAAAGNGRKLAVADLGADGDADVVATSITGGVRAYENASTGRSAGLGLLGWTFHPFSPGVTLTDLETADVDGDGRLDLVAVWEDGSPADSVLSWYAGIGAATPSGVLQLDSLAHVVRQGTVARIESVALGDVDDDGDADAFVGEKLFAGQAYWFCRNDGGGTGWSCFDVGANHYFVDALELADVDADGDLDAVAAAQESINGTWYVLWWEQGTDPTSGWTRHDIAADGPFTKLEVVDLDRDGDLDVVAGHDWWRNDGGSPPVWMAQTIPTLWNAPFPVEQWAVGDVDGDGDPDLAGSTGLGAIAWARNDLPAAWTGYAFIPPSVSNSPIGDFTFADVDRDGDLDLLGGSLKNLPPTPPQSGLSWFENDVASGPFAWTEHAVEPGGAVPAHLRAADFDRDGDADVVMAVGAEMQSWLNGGGQFALEASPVGAAAIVEGREAAVLALDAFHRGRAGEAALELAAVSLLFEEAPGDPLSQGQLGALVEAVRLYRDDGSGTFVPGLDAEVAAFGVPALTTGEALLELADGVAGLQQTPGDAAVTYFLTLDLTAGAASAGVAGVRVSHTPGVACTLCTALPQRSSAAENATFDHELTQEVSAPAAMSFTVLPDTFGASGFSDGFESGSTGSWDGAVP